ncbi:hypothetical protein B0H10DRAFT_1999036, partial [Mycena sp. CBHHK59/15]
MCDYPRLPRFSLAPAPLGLPSQFRPAAARPGLGVGSPIPTTNTRVLPAHPTLTTHPLSSGVVIGRGHHHREHRDAAGLQRETMRTAREGASESVGGITWVSHL